VVVAQSDERPANITVFCVETIRQTQSVMVHTKEEGPSDFRIRSLLSLEKVLLQVLSILNEIRSFPPDPSFLSFDTLYFKYFLLN